MSFPEVMLMVGRRYRIPYRVSRFTVVDRHRSLIVRRYRGGSCNQCPDRSLVQLRSWSSFWRPGSVARFRGHNHCSCVQGLRRGWSASDTVDWVALLCHCWHAYASPDSPQNHCPGISCNSHRSLCCEIVFRATVDTPVSATCLLKCPSCHVVVL